MERCLHYQRKWNYWWYMMIQKRCSLSTLVIVFTLIFYVSCSPAVSAQIDYLRRMSRTELQNLLRSWYRYYQVLERQGLTSESDRSHVGKTYVTMNCFFNLDLMCDFEFFVLFLCLPLLLFREWCHTFHVFCITYLLVVLF